MKTKVNGFLLEVTMTDGIPTVRISLSEGGVVLETDKVSVTGLYNLSAVFETAASIARKQLESYYNTERNRR